MQCYEDKDFPGYDICQIQNTRDPKEMFEICQFIPNAAGFNSFGWVKYHIPDNVSSLKNEPCNLYRFSRPFIQLYGELPEIWSTSTREDVREVLKSTFKVVQFCENDLLKQLTGKSFLIMQDRFQLVDGFLEKLSHAIAQLPVDYDILSISNTGTFSDDFPKVLPFVGKLDGGYVITKSGVEKMLNNQPVRIWSTFPHLIKYNH